MSGRKLLGALGAISVATFLLSPVSAQGGEDVRTVSISPNTDLRLQVVTVSWSGFEPSGFSTNKIVVLQCLDGATEYADCYTSPRADPSRPGNAVGWLTNSFYGTTGPDGTGSVPFEVLPARFLPELGCGADNECELVLYDETEAGPVDPLGPLPAEYYTVDLAFSEAAAVCDAGIPSVVVNGEQSLAYAMDDWASATCGDDGPAPYGDFTLTSGPEGRAAALSGTLADVGVTSRGLPEATRVGAPPVVYAPLQATATVIVYRIADAITGQQITDLTLSPRLVARLLSSSAADSSHGLPPQILFNDPEFRALNPGGGIEWPSGGAYNPYVRLEHHDDAYLVTAYLAADADARLFLTGADPCSLPINPYWDELDGGIPGAVDTYPTDVFENRSANDDNLGYRPRQGTSNVTRTFFNGIINQTWDPIAEVFKDGPGDGTGRFYAAFAVVDLTTAVAYGLPIARLVPAAADPVITSCTGGVAVRRADAPVPQAPDTPALEAAYALLPADPGTAPDLAYAAAVDDAGAYPLARIDYAMVRTSGFTAEHAADVADFVVYAADDGQALMPFSLPTLPTTFRERAAVAAAAVRTQAGAPPPTSTTSTTLFTPTTSGGGGTGGSGFVTTRPQSTLATTASTGTPPEVSVVPGRPPSEADGDEISFAEVESGGAGKLGALLALLFPLATAAAVVGALLRRNAKPSPTIPPSPAP